MSEAWYTEFIDAVAAAVRAGNDEQVQALYASLSEEQRVALQSPELMRLRDAIRELDCYVDLLRLAGAFGPFTFRTVEELSRVVELTTRVTIDDALRPPEQMSVEDREAIEDKLGDLLLTASELAAENDANRDLEPLTLITRWSFKLGGKQHAAVVPADLPKDEYPERFQTLCGQGWGFHFLPIHISAVDCPGCRNALILGGFLKTEPETGDGGEM